MNRFTYPALLLTVGLLSLTDKPATTDWPEYNGGPDRNHFCHSRSYIRATCTPSSIRQSRRGWGRG